MYVRKALCDQLARASSGLSIRISSSKLTRGSRPQLAKKEEAPVAAETWLFPENSAKGSCLA